MIKTIISGGIGNQMFQYAFIYSQIKNNNLKPELYAVMFGNNIEDKRNFSLDSLSCSIKIYNQTKKDSSLQFKYKLIAKKVILKILNRKKANEIEIMETLKKHNICFSPTIFKYYPELEINNNTYVEGYFQTWKYFDKYKDDIKKEFIVSKKISKKNDEMKKRIENCQAVCVHIRRGDYINTEYSKCLQICNFDYYKSGMDYIASKVKDPIFFIFSNSHKDHEWIKQNYKFNYNIVHVDLDNPDYEELRLMYSCKHFILSNSTFSFWAQYLSENNNKEVVAPSLWYLDNRDDPRDIYMPNWKIIDVGGNYENFNRSK